MTLVSILSIGWRKLACYFGLSFEIKDKVIEFDEKRDVRRAEFVVRAFTQYVPSPYIICPYINTQLVFNHSQYLLLSP